MSNCDILFVSPPSRTNTQRMPLGLMCLAATLQEGGFSCEIVDPKADTEAERTIVRRIQEVQPKAVGVTCCATEVVEVDRLCTAVRVLAPDAKIILGGPHPTYKPEHFSRVPHDYLVRGEADDAIVDVMDEIRKGGDDLLGTIQATQVRDLDALPFPSYEHIDVEYYAKPSVWAIRFIYLSALGIMTARGCPYHCKFCVAHSVFGRKIRQLSPERTAQLVEQLVDRYRLDGVFWFDECFTAKKKWVRDVCDRVRGLDIVWGCQTRPHLTDEALLRDMKRAGCVQVDVGYESGSQRMLDGMQKQETVAQFESFAAAAKQAGLRTLGNMMINLPGERRQDVRLSTEFLCRVEPHVVLWGPYIPIPGVTFGRELTLMDLSRFSPELLETKYKFAEYETRLEDVLKMAHDAFPYAKKPQFSFYPRYWWRWLRFFSYAFTWWYWRALLKSRRRWQYLSPPRLLRQRAMR